MMNTSPRRFPRKLETIRDDELVRRYLGMGGLARTAGILSRTGGFACHPGATGRTPPRHDELRPYRARCLVDQSVASASRTTIQFLTDLRAATWVDVVHIDSAIDSAAWALWMSRPDKNWSLVDCASFIVMQSQGLTEALTTDHHFEQAGFTRLLK